MSVKACDPDLIGVDRHALYDLLLAIGEAVAELPEVAELVAELASELADQPAKSSAAIPKLSRLDACVETLRDTARNPTDAADTVDNACYELVAKDGADEASGQ